MSLINELGIIALASRLERLSDLLKKDASKVYTENRLGKYKWYPVLYAIDRSGPVGVGELASELSYAHPSIIQILGELEQEKLIRSTGDKDDSRRRLVSLTPKGQRVLASVIPYIESFKKALMELTETENNLLKALDEVERNLGKKSFYDRVQKFLDKVPGP